MSYEPEPIDTSAVALPSGLEPLIERLAANNHDQWALQRMRDGWTYGRERDDARKTHPDLRAYDELEEAEKEYDRISVIETLKAILALGYEIRRASSER